MSRSQRCLNSVFGSDSMSKSRKSDLLQSLCDFFFGETHGFPYLMEGTLCKKQQPFNFVSKELAHTEMV